MVPAYVCLPMKEIVMANEQENRGNYWNAHYGKQTALVQMAPPSQFAAFIMSEISNDITVFDLGCGNARDSIFFALYGFNVMGFDQSETAVDMAAKTAKERGLPNAQFVACDVVGPEIYAALTKRAGTAKCIYARFFLHAITQQEQDFMLTALADALEPGDLIAFEYRTDEDADASKVMGHGHFRRYQSGASVNARLEALGFERIYSTDGHGFAKYKFEDAAVARCIFKR